MGLVSFRTGCEGRSGPRWPAILQPHLVELGRGRPALLVVAAFGQGLLVAPPGGPGPDMVRADGMAEPLDGEKAPYRGHRERHDGQPAALARSVARSGGGTRPVPSSAGSARRIAVPPGEARGPEGVPPPTDRPATAAARASAGTDQPRADHRTRRAGRAPRGSALVCQPPGPRSCADLRRGLPGLGGPSAWQQTPRISPPHPPLA